MTMRAEINSRPRRLQADLISDSKTLSYELRMLLEIASEFSYSATISNPILKNALIEAFAIHCRALTFFLFGHLVEIAPGIRFGAINGSDVLATDYSDHWKTNCYSPTQVIANAKKQADKYIAHITTDRREVNQPGSVVTESRWVIGEVSQDIAQAFAAFLQSAPESNIHSASRQEMLQLIQPWLPHSNTESANINSNSYANTNPNWNTTGRTSS